MKKRPLEKYAPLPLIPGSMLMLLWLISLTLPNLIYSGIMFADTLHILKWTVSGVPVAIAVMICGYRIMRYGQERISVRLDAFSLIWLVILV